MRGTRGSEDDYGTSEGPVCEEGREKRVTFRVVARARQLHRSDPARCAGVQ